ncbi:hypothetical protein H131_09528 [Lysinibacillus sphaericus OT4b.31]|uniref:Methyltransferase n=1 Tax=Lysinibacillus sphaericus OT4b.31 TaxID=1285586 RepID=R7ZFY3_LYSSH|nr:hypothetical protein H131_09528 [Lysinibacillus sphaericus OT4b.31]
MKFWFDKQNEDALYMDIRQTSDTLCDGRKLEVNPYILADLRNMPFEDTSFYLVVFDPPHLFKAGEESWLDLMKILGKVIFQKDSMNV